MIYFGSSGTRSTSRERLETISSSTAKPGRRNVSMTDNAARAIANLQMSNPEVYQATMQELALLTNKGDKLMLTEHGDNATQVRAERANQSLQNVSGIEQWVKHTGVGSKMESVGLHAKVMANKLLSTLDTIDPSGVKTGELRAELQKHTHNLDSKLNPSAEEKKK